MDNDNLKFSRGYDEELKQHYVICEQCKEKLWFKKDESPVNEELNVVSAHATEVHNFKGNGQITLPS